MAEMEGEWVSLKEKEGGREGGRKAEGEVGKQLCLLPSLLLPSMVSTESSEKESRLYLQLVVDTHVFMATEVERRLLLADSPDHSHEGSEDTEDET